MKTLITDEFADDDSWMDADDRALLLHTVGQIVEKHIRAIKPAIMAEPDVGTFWLDRHAPGGPRVWVHRTKDSPGWLMTGSHMSYWWTEVLAMLGNRVLVQLFESPSFPA